MSIEFVADIDCAANWQTAILEAVKGDPEYQLLSPSESGSVLLRLTKNPPREKWPEDVTILFEEKRVSVVFHAATRNDRESLIQLLEMTLGQIGCPVRFLEE